MQSTTTCNACSGTGKIVTKKAPGSDANGQILTEETVEVKIPAGVEDGMQLRVSGKGNDAISDGISGDLLGDLYKQGREIGYILTGTSDGYIPNDTMVWGAQLYKGHVFYSDFNTGIGVAKVSDLKPNNSMTNQYVD